MECKYAKALEAAGRLKIVYLMMEEDFTTTSETAIGGWLRLYMEDALWYQCWDDELVEEAAGKVTRVLEEREGKVEREKREAGEEKAALAEAREVTGAAAAAFSALAPEVVAWLTHNKLEALLPAFAEHEISTLRESSAPTDFLTPRPNSHFPTIPIALLSRSHSGIGFHRRRT
mmetsp:Transcript_3684/g.8880  ORF Transcript_3684/g.8880 Transcript_3684/m.8880 type:complete len:174 (-) Transcript_3684:793-1314(-)